MVAATQLASSASMCWMAWKVEIERPNCTRCLEYSTAVASTLSAAPGHLHGAHQRRQLEGPIGADGRRR